MSKKMLKRSLALGALMAFVITGSAMAADVTLTADGTDEKVGKTGISNGGKAAVVTNAYENDGALTVNAVASSIATYGNNAEMSVKADSITLNTQSGTAILVTRDTEDNSTGGNRLTVTATNGDLEINAITGDAHGIAVANNNGSLTLNAKGTVSVKAAENAVYARNEGAEVTIEATDVKIESTNTGEEKDSKGHAVYVDKKAQVNIIASGDVTLKAIEGKDAIGIHGREDQVRGAQVSIEADNNVDIDGQVENWQKSTITVDGKNITMNSTDANINSIGGSVIISADENITLTSEADGIFTCAATVNFEASNIKVDAADWGLSITDNGNDVDLNASNINIVGDKGGVRALGSNSNVDLVSEVDTQIDGDVIAGNATAVINVAAENDVTVNGNVMAQKGQILVGADNNVTVNGNVESRSGEGSGHLPYVGIKAGEDVVVNGSLVAHWAEGSKDGSRPEGLKLEGNNITVDAAEANVLYNGAGKTSFVAEDNLVLKGQNGLVNEGGIINVTADNINIEAENSAIISYSGTTEIAPSGSSNIVGDIFVDDLYGKATPVVNVNLGENGSLTGAVINEHTGTGSGVNLNLGTGSTWNVTGDSNVTSLAGEDNNIKFDVNKEGNIATLAITTNSATGTQVSGTGAVSDYLAANGYDAENAFADSVKDLDSDGVLTTEEGIVGGAYTLRVNENGSVEATQAVNTKSDAVSDAGMTLKGHWRAHMNDMNKRMGDLRMANGETGVWTRMVRGESEYQGAKMQYNQYQLGYDEKLSVDKRWTVGAAVTFSEGDASYAQGSTDDKSTAFAIYGSKLNNDGTFVDLIARYAHLESDLEDRVYGNGDYSTNGMSVSAEFGKRIEQGNGLWIEPQVELTYGTIDSADVVLGNKYKAHYDSLDSFIARAGFALGKDIKQGNVYARASYLYDFDGETTTQFEGGKPIEEDFGGGWWEVGVGANINLSKATYIYADVEKTFGGEVDTNWQWNLGVRYSF